MSLPSTPTGWRRLRWLGADGLPLTSIGHICSDDQMRSDGISQREQLMDERTTDAEDRTTTATEDMSEKSGRQDGLELPESGREAGPLFAEEQSASYRSRWDDIQARFVDDPRGAVREADELVSMVIGELESSFHSRRDSLEAGWQQGDDTSTEGLRLALQAYRSFFGRLLST